MRIISKIIYLQVGLQNAQTKISLDKDRKEMIDGVEKKILARVLKLSLEATGLFGLSEQFDYSHFFSVRGNYHQRNSIARRPTIIIKER